MQLTSKSSTFLISFVCPGPELDPSKHKSNHFLVRRQDFYARKRNFRVKNHRQPRFLAKIIDFSP